MSTPTSISRTLNRVLKGELCSGCGLCASISGGAIQMASESPGYARPRQSGPISAEAERIVALACPGSVVSPWPSNGEVHPYWGPWRGVMTGAAIADDVRFNGSSGGAISALLIHALEAGLVDRVLHVGADPGDPTRNRATISRNSSEIVAHAGSRYTASSPLEVIETELSAGGAMAFVGKPCDVSALRQLAQQDPRVDQHIPIMLSFFCGGIPSHAGVGRILKTLGVLEEDVTEFRFRGRGWPGNCVATTASGSAEMTYAESWGGHLSKEVQFRCKICPDAVGGAADIACADAWYGDDEGYPSFEEQEGRSLIVSRTAAGEQLIAAAVDAGRLTTDPLEIEEIEKMQPSQARRKRLVAARTAALPLVLQPVPRMTGLSVGVAAARAPIGEAFRNLLGTLRRTLKGARSRL